MAFAKAAVAGKAGERLRRGTGALVLLPLLMCCSIAEKLKIVRTSSYAEFVPVLLLRSCVSVGIKEKEEGGKLPNECPRNSLMHVSVPSRRWLPHKGLLCPAVVVT